VPPTTNVVVMTTTRSSAYRRPLAVLVLLGVAALAWALWPLRGEAGETDEAAAGAARSAGPAGDVPTALAAPGDPDAAGSASATQDLQAQGLDPELAERFAAAQTAAAADGVELTLTSGWRSADDQQRIVDATLERYGTPEGYRWVLPPEDSAHVQGLAVDVGPTEGAYWLQQHGLELGLCPTYANEVWHFEKLPDGAAECPEPHEDASWAW
jgi:hypothetical protein